MVQPKQVSTMYVLAVIAGSFYAALAIVFFVMSILDTTNRAPGIALASVALALAMTRFTVASGLSRLRRWARNAEVAYSWLWIAACAVMISHAVLGSIQEITDSELELEMVLPWAASYALVSIWKLVVLRSRTMLDAFAKEPETPSTVDRRVMAAATLGLIGLLLAYFLPNQIAAIDRTRENRTIQAMQSLRIAIEEYRQKNKKYPAVTTIDELWPLLEPTQIKGVARVDAWGNPYHYARRAKADGTDVYRLGSAGKDGRWERSDIWAYTFGGFSTFDGDLVVENGNYVRYYQP